MMYETENPIFCLRFEDYGFQFVLYVFRKRIVLWNKHNSIIGCKMKSDDKFVGSDNTFMIIDATHEEMLASGYVTKSYVADRLETIITSTSRDSFFQFLSEMKGTYEV